MASLPALHALDETARRLGRRDRLLAGEESPNTTSDSSVIVGLTALMRTPRGSSIAALRTNPSTPALTNAPDAPNRMGSSLICPVIKVNEPPSRMCFRPRMTRLTWPISLLRKPTSSCSCVNSASGPKWTSPVVLTTASKGPTFS